MNAIIGLSHLLRTSRLTPEQAVKLDKIDGAGKHLLSIINDILDISKIEAGRVELESEDGNKQRHHKRDDGLAAFVEHLFV